MESIRININKQLGREGLVPVITYPAESSYDFRLRSCKEDMGNLTTTKAYHICIYPDGSNMQVSLLKGIDDGFIEYSVLTDLHHQTIDGRKLMEALSDLESAYSAVTGTAKPIENKAFQDAVAKVHKKLVAEASPGYPLPLPVCKTKEDNVLTYYMNYKTEGEILTLIKYPDQEFFKQTTNIYLVDENVHPGHPQACKHIHSLVLRTFKIKSPDGYEYGQVKEGETTRISLKGKEGMLPMTIDVKGDVTKPTAYGYYDTATSTIRIDERTIKFYYELKFIVKYNDRRLRSCIIRYNGEQVMPDSNGCYLIKVYEDKVNDAGYIHFTGENLKDARIQVTPGIVKQQEYVFNPEPMHDMTRITLDFGDGRPIEARVDVGTNDRLFHQLNQGKVKGYRVKKEGDDFKMFIPRKLTASSKNILRFMKFVAMVVFTLAAYALASWLFTQHWPWPIERHAPVTQQVSQDKMVNERGEVTSVPDDEQASGLITDQTDQVTLENKDFAYLQNNNVWRRDSIRSNKYQDVINTIFNGRLSEIKMKGYNAKVISNEWWEQVWRNVIVPNNIHSDAAREVFQQVITPDHNSLDVQMLYEELSKRLMPTGDAIRQSNGVNNTGASTFPKAAQGTTSPRPSQGTGTPKAAQGSGAPNAAQGANSLP